MQGQRVEPGGRWGCVVPDLLLHLFQCVSITLNAPRCCFQNFSSEHACIMLVLTSTAYESWKASSLPPFTDMACFNVLSQANGEGVLAPFVFKALPSSNAARAGTVSTRNRGKAVAKQQTGAAKQSSRVVSDGWIVGCRCRFLQ